MVDDQDMVRPAPARDAVLVPLHPGVVRRGDCHPHHYSYPSQSSRERDEKEEDSEKDDRADDRAILEMILGPVCLQGCFPSTRRGTRPRVRAGRNVAAVPPRA